MVDWQVTATTIFCDAVADEVTIIMNSDLSVKCTGLVKYAGDRKARLELVKRSLNLKRVLDCTGIGCARIAEYKQKLQLEEAVKAGRTGEKK